MLKLKNVLVKAQSLLDKLVKYFFKEIFQKQLKIKRNFINNITFLIRKRKNKKFRTRPHVKF